MRRKTVPRRRSFDLLAAFNAMDLTLKDTFTCPPASNLDRVNCLQDIRALHAYNTCPISSTREDISEGFFQIMGQCSHLDSTNSIF